MEKYKLPEEQGSYLRGIVEKLALVPCSELKVVYKLMSYYLMLPGEEITEEMYAARLEAMREACNHA